MADGQEQAQLMRLPLRHHVEQEVAVDKEMETWTSCDLLGPVFLGASVDCFDAPPFST